MKDTPKYTSGQIRCHNVNEKTFKLKQNETVHIKMYETENKIEG